MSLPSFITLDPEKRRFTIFSTFIDGKILIGNKYQIRVKVYQKGVFQPTFKTTDFKIYIEEKMQTDCMYTTQVIPPALPYYILLSGSS